MGAPAGNAVKRLGWQYRFGRTCSAQRMPSGRDRAIEDFGQRNCLTTALITFSFRAVVRDHTLIKQLIMDVPVES